MNPTDKIVCEKYQDCFFSKQKHEVVSQARPWLLVSLKYNPDT
jgi:hypothetical protein